MLYIETAPKHIFRDSNLDVTKKQKSARLLGWAGQQRASPAERPNLGIARGCQHIADPILQKRFALTVCRCTPRPFAIASFGWLIIVAVRSASPQQEPRPSGLPSFGMRRCARCPSIHAPERLTSVEVAPLCEPQEREGVGCDGVP